MPAPIAVGVLLATDSSGAVAGGWTSWPGGLSGSSLYWQFAVQNAAAVCGVALSNALRADIP